MAFGGGGGDSWGWWWYVADLQVPPGVPSPPPPPPPRMQSLGKRCITRTHDESSKKVHFMYSLQTLTFGIMFMRLYDYLSQEQTSGFIYNKVPYFCAIRNGGFHIYIYIYVKNILGCKLSSVDVCENTAKKNACNRP